MTETQKLDAILVKMDENFKKIDEKFDKIDEKFDKIDEKFDKIDENFKKIDENFDKMDERFDKLDTRVRKIEVTLENETNKNILIVSEGHLDLSRKLDEALKTSQTNAMYHMKVNHLAGEVQLLKEAIGMN